MLSSTLDMAMKRRRLLFSVMLIVIIVICVFQYWHSNYKLIKQDDKSLYELDLYDDGDYDEGERNIPKWKFSKENIGWMIARRIKPTSPKPTPFTPQIVIQNNKAISLSMSMSYVEIEENFFRFLEQKDIICKKDERLGFQHDGGWNVCFSPPFGLKKPCIIYSFGIGNNWNFDDATSRIYGCQVLSYDPSLTDLKDHNRSSLITFKKIGIDYRNGINTKGWKMKTLKQFIHDEGHDNILIDYVKFDIEFGEWMVLKNILEERSLRNVKQVGFEIHTMEFFSRFKNPKLSSHSTKQDFIRMFKILKLLEKQNFKQFNYRKNPFGEYDSPASKKKRSCCYELHYINMNLVSRNYTTPVAEDKASERTKP